MSKQIFINTFHRMYKFLLCENKLLPIYLRKFYDDDIKKLQIICELSIIY